MADLASQPTVIQSIYGWYREGRINVNRHYQRKLVWTLEEKQRLIESIIKRYPIPAILLAESGDDIGKFEIIDGLQRLHAIVSFIENAFPTLDGRFFDVDAFNTARTYADGQYFNAKKDVEKTSSKESSNILDYTLALSIMRNASVEEVNDVFDRINTYGHRLSDQERRQAGVQNRFSELVRDVACTLRGDVSTDKLPLYDMPSISIDLPKSSHGYAVQASDVFWVDQGILRSTELRDSLDEQCIADIAASLCRGEVIERSKDMLDQIYTEGSDECRRTLDAFDAYGPDKIRDEILYCIQEIQKFCAAGHESKLRDIIYKTKSTNPFPSVFAVIFLAVHDVIFNEKKRVSDYEGLKHALDGIFVRLETTRKVTAVAERQKNINTIKGIISECFVADEFIYERVYQNHTTIDVDSILHRSQIELPNYELKQGILAIDTHTSKEDGVVQRIVETISAIANIGPSATGKIIIGVCDKEKDAGRVLEVDGVAAKKVGSRFVVGVNREAHRMGGSVEDYFHILRQGIENSELSDSLKKDVMSSIDYNEYFGYGLIIISVRGQSDISCVGESVFYRSGDQTLSATSPREIADIAKRFSKWR